MVNAIWVALLLGGLAYGAAHGRLGDVTGAFMSQGGAAVQTSIQLAGIVAVWFGISRIAERAGLIDLLARAMAPLFGRLFPDVPPQHPAMGAIVMNMAANTLGLGNAATPFGLKAMRELQELNPRRDTASPAMVTFLAINSAAISLLPATTIAVRAAAGSHHPAEIAGPAMIVTGASMVAVLIATQVWRRTLPPGPGAGRDGRRG